MKLVLSIAQAFAAVLLTLIGIAITLPIASIGVLITLPIGLLGMHLLINRNRLFLGSTILLIGIVGNAALPLTIPGNIYFYTCSTSPTSCLTSKKSPLFEDVTIYPTYDPVRRYLFSQLASNSERFHILKAEKVGRYHLVTSEFEQGWLEILSISPQWNGTVRSSPFPMEIYSDNNLDLSMEEFSQEHTQTDRRPVFEFSRSVGITAAPVSYTVPISDSRFGFFSFLSNESISTEGFLISAEQNTLAKMLLQGHASLARIEALLEIRELTSLRLAYLQKLRRLRTGSLQLPKFRQSAAAACTNFDPQLGLLNFSHASAILGLGNTFDFAETGYRVSRSFVSVDYEQSALLSTFKTFCNPLNFAGIYPRNSDTLIPESAASYTDTELLNYPWTPIQIEVLRSKPELSEHLLDSIALEIERTVEVDAPIWAKNARTLINSDTIDVEQLSQVLTHAGIEDIGKVRFICDELDNAPSAFQLQQRFNEYDNVIHDLHNMTSTVNEHIEKPAADASVGASIGQTIIEAINVRRRRAAALDGPRTCKFWIREFSLENHQYRQLIYDPREESQIPRMLQSQLLESSNDFIDLYESPADECLLQAAEYAETEAIDISISLGLLEKTALIGNWSSWFDCAATLLGEEISLSDVFDPTYKNETTASSFAVIAESLNQKASTRELSIEDLGFIYLFTRSHAPEHIEKYERSFDRTIGSLPVFVCIFAHRTNPDDRLCQLSGSVYWPGLDSQ